MDRTLILLFMLTFIIHLVGTLAYSVRISGVRSGAVAVSFALFNIMVIGSRTANSFQGLFLSKRIEQNLSGEILHGSVTDFRVMLLAASSATIAGIFFTPTFQRLFTMAAGKLMNYRSMYLVLLKGFSPAGLFHIKKSLTAPSMENLKFYKNSDHIPCRYIFFNTIATAVWCTGIFSALYAGYLNPELRLTSSQLSSIINGFATILLIVFIDPYFSMLTDDASKKRINEAYFRRSVIWLSASRLAGTFIAQLLLVPAAMLIVTVAEMV
jgi:hypothetical protein